MVRQRYAWHEKEERMFQSGRVGGESLTYSISIAEVIFCCLISSSDDRRAGRASPNQSVLIREREGAGSRRDDAGAGGTCSSSFTSNFIRWVKLVVKNITGEFASTVSGEASHDSLEFLN